MTIEEYLHSQEIEADLIQIKGPGPGNKKRIFGIMLDRLGPNEQLIFTTHNTDMLDLNLPKHSYVFLRKHLVDDRYQVSAISASDVLKRNTDSLRCAVENDVFASLPQDSLLDELEIMIRSRRCRLKM